MKKKKNYYLFAILILWLTLSFIEIVCLVFVWPKPIYWRAWEAVSNYTGKDHVYAPFKPYYRYDNGMVGDLLNVTNALPFPGEKRKQVFQVDEYGFRNPIGMLDHPITAVITGSSFVAGAAETQENLVSTILTDTYKIPTYNAALYILQDLVEDKRFIDKPPKYIILLGGEGDFVGATYRYAITDRGIINTPKKWKSYDEWRRNEEQIEYSYNALSQYVLINSLLRQYLNTAYVAAVNFGRSRAEVIKTAKLGIGSTDSTGMIFYQIDYDNPTLGSTGKTEKDIKEAIVVLGDTQQKLKQNGTTLIVAAMPSKSNLESIRYKNLPKEKRAIVQFEKELDKANITHINLFEKTYSYMKNGKNHLYYFDDGHWNARANEIISKLLADKIKTLENNE